MIEQISKKEDEQTVRLLQKIDEVQSKGCNMMCRNIAYGVFASAWGIIMEWEKMSFGHKQDKTFFFILIGACIFYFVLDAARYYWVSLRARQLLNEVCHYKPDMRLVVMDRTSRFSFRVLTFQMFYCWGLLGATIWLCANYL